MEDQKYPKWIDEYAKAFHNGFVNMIPCSWGPIDLYALLGFLNGSFLSKLYEAVSKLKNEKVPLEKVAATFPSPSGFRVAIYWAILEYQLSNPKNKQRFKETLEFFIDILRILIKRDIFAYQSNIAHSPEEIKEILNNTPWQEGNSETARELGKLYNSLAALVFALYKDFFPQDSHEIYGPYNASEKFEEGSMLLIKHFPKIRPVELWPEMKDLKNSEVKIFQVFNKNVSFRCELIGMHSIYEGDLINNLISWAVIADGKFINNVQEIKEMSNYYAEVAMKHSVIYEKMGKEELKQKTLEWLCYQFVYFFKLAGMDWRPTKQMLDAVKGKEVADRFELDTAPTYEEYASSPDFEVYWLKDLYQ